VRWKVVRQQKLVEFLQEHLDPVPSGKALRKALEANACRVNGVVERFGSATVRPGAVVELADDWNKAAPKQKILVLFEDEHLLIANKPPGWVCTDDLCKKTFGRNTALIHRLDKDTSGLLLVAKTESTRLSMIDQFKAHSVEKWYLALVDGVVKQDHGVRESFLTKVGAFQGQTRYGSRARGQHAKTVWQVLARGKTATLVLCQPVTGRTHQLRVHLAEMGHPILGDRQYAERFRCGYFAGRVLLHATRLKFKHPVSGELVDLEVKPPGDFEAAVKTVT